MATKILVFLVSILTSLAVYALFTAFDAKREIERLKNELDKHKKDVDSLKDNVEHEVVGLYCIRNELKEDKKIYSALCSCLEKKIASLSSDNRRELIERFLKWEDSQNESTTTL